MIEETRESACRCLASKAHGALLSAEAERRHRDVDTTAEDLLAEPLAASATIDEAGLQRTLERAARLRAQLSRTEQAVALVREGREELEGRTGRL